MYLKSLELHGFKSFPEKTVLNFDSGTTVIVGPNGSGKSNITDAMRWVLGELSSHSIRGTKMEDVIFIGSDGRKPMSFAEVSVTFDNRGEPRIDCPYDEVTVTRRYYRAGESEYFINRQPCRLKDISALFMNTGIGREGYSIVGQGKIAEIISKKSEDRRSIFEEAAGISVLRKDKTDAEKRLADTDANVARVMDIFSELESRLPVLERESQKAKKYLETYEEKKQLDIALWIYDYERMNKDLEKAESDCRLSAHELEMILDTESGVE
ncbi:MAG: AAA family ATPase, partial [Clostridia bacterium]|nr:AAA family ATPase [Clostridia bacterium]